MACCVPVLVLVPVPQDELVNKFGLLGDTTSGLNANKVETEKRVEMLKDEKAVRLLSAVYPRATDGGDKDDAAHH